MFSFAGDFIIHHPSLDDAQTTLDLMLAYDVANFGEFDSSFGDLVDQWSDIDLNKNAWLVIVPQDQSIGYAADKYYLVIQ